MDFFFRALPQRIDRVGQIDEPIINQKTDETLLLQTREDHSQAVFGLFFLNTWRSLLSLAGLGKALVPPIQSESHTDIKPATGREGQDEISYLFGRVSFDCSPARLTDRRSYPGKEQAKVI